MTRQLESGPDPELMATDSKGERIYIANEDDSLVTIMDIKSGEVLGEVPVGVEPEGMIVSPDDRYTAATSESTSMAHIIDNATMKLVGNILVDSRPREAKFTQDMKELWVSSEVGGTISVIDTSNWDDPKSWKVKEKISFEVPGVRPEQLQPVGMDFTLDDKLIFVPLGPSNRVAVIDTATKEVKDYILVGQRPWHGELAPDGKKYYVANGLTNDVTIIDIASLKAEKSVPVGRLPWGVAIMP
jgi:PQQ-dependent catabolism-associated beta-propeller protein